MQECDNNIREGSERAKAHAEGSTLPLGGPSSAAKKTNQSAKVTVYHIRDYDLHTWRSTGDSGRSGGVSCCEPVLVIESFIDTSKGETYRCLPKKGFGLNDRDRIPRHRVVLELHLYDGPNWPVMPTGELVHGCPKESPEKKKDNKVPHSGDVKRCLKGWLKRLIVGRRILGRFNLWGSSLMV